MARYVPLLRWKRGERVGLRNVSVTLRQDVLPLFMLVSDQFKEKPAKASRPALSAADAFVNELMSTWGNAPCLIDASAVASSSGHPHPLVQIAASARQHGCQIIPATSLYASHAYQQDVATVYQIDQRGAALRVDLAGLTSANSWATSWPFPPSATDLIADFGDTVGTVSALGASADHAFQSLHLGARWRTVTVAGTSMPDNFGGYQSGLHTIARQEWALWQRLAGLNLPYQIDYGDYTTVPVNAPPPGIAWGFPINARYTLPGEFLICRGVGTTGYGARDMADQLVDHARNIRNYVARQPIAGCWADAEIDNIATGARGPGNLEHWVQIGVCRHIERVRTDLP